MACFALPAVVINAKNVGTTKLIQTLGACISAAAAISLLFFNFWSW